MLYPTAYLPDLLDYENIAKDPHTHTHYELERKII